MGMVLSGTPVTVETKHLSMIAELSGNLIYSTSRIELNYTSDGRVACILNTKRSDSMFDVRCKPNPNAVPLEKFVGLQARILQLIFKIFVDSPTLDVRITRDGLGIVEDNLSVALLGDKS
jgi:hypothetical protein